MPELQSYFKGIPKGDILISYNGIITKKDINNMIIEVENKLDSVNETLKTRKKVFNIIIEAIQNIYHHGASNGKVSQELKNVCLYLLRSPNGYKIITVNHIYSHNVEELSKRLEETNALSKEQLKEYYRNRLEMGKVSNKGGAGLGLIDMFRKSGEKLNYWFEEANGKFSLFCLEVSINS